MPIAGSWLGCHCCHCDTVATLATVVILSASAYNLLTKDKERIGLNVFIKIQSKLLIVSILDFVSC
jgi:hypothetical protein